MRVGIIGFGRHSSGFGKSVRVPKHYEPYSIFKASLDNPMVSGIAVCDTSIEARTLANSLKIPSFDEVDDMITAFRPDVVVISTRSDSRFDLLEKSHSLGVNYFHLEKPLLSSRTQLKKLEFLSRTGVRFTYGTLGRYLSPYKKVKSLIDSGRFGSLKHVKVNFGRSLLFWTHPHSLDFITYFWGTDLKGEDIRVFARGEPVHQGFFNDKLVNTDFYIDSLDIERENEGIASITSLPGDLLELTTESGKFTIEAFGKSIFFHPNVGYERECIWLEYMSDENEGYGHIVKLLAGLVDGDKHLIEFVNNAMVDAFASQELTFRVADSLCNLKSEDLSRKYVPLGPQGLSA